MVFLYAAKIWTEKRKACGVRGEKMVNEIYYIGFPGAGMMTHGELVPFEVLEENEKTLRIRLLEDEPTLEGLTEDDLHKAGEEFTIQNQYRAVKLTDHLRTGGIAPWYVSKGSKPEDHFSGCIFPTNHQKK